MADRDANFLFRTIFQALNADKVEADVNSVTDALQRNQSAINNQSNAAQGVANSFRDINNAIPFDAVSNEINDATARTKLLNAELDKVNTQNFDDIRSELGLLASQGLDTSSGTGGIGEKKGRQSGSNLQQFGSTLFNLPSIPIPGQSFGTDTFGRALRGLGQLGVSVEQLGVAAVPTFVAITALAVVIKDITSAIEDARKAEEARNNAIREFAQFEREGSTSVEASNIIRDLQGNVEADRETLRSLEDRLALLDDIQVQALGSDPIGARQRAEEAGLFDPNASGSLGLQLGGVRTALLAQIDELNNDIITDAAQLDEYRNALDSGKLAANDATAAQQQLAEVYQSEVAFATDATVQQVQERIDALTQEAQIETERQRLFSDNAEVVTDANNNISIINDQIAVLSTKGLELARSNEARIATEERLLDAQQNAIARALSEPETDARRSSLFDTINLEGFNDAVQAQQDLLDVYKQQTTNLLELEAAGIDVSDQLAEVTANTIAATDELNALAGEGLNAAIFNQAIESGKEFKAVLDEAGVATRELSDNLDSELTKLSDQLAKSISDAAKKRDRALEDLDDKSTRDRLKAQEDRNEKLEDLEADLAAKRAKILRDFGRDSLNAIANRDALALFLAKQKRDDELQDLDDSAKNRRDKINDEYNKQTADILEKLQLQREEILETFEQRRQDAIENEQRLAERARQEYQQRLQLLQQQTAQELNIRRQAVANELAELEKLDIQGTGIIGSFVSKALSYIDRLGNSGRTTSSNTSGVTQGEQLYQRLGNQVGGIFNAGGMNVNVTNRTPNTIDPRMVQNEVSKGLNKLLQEAIRQTRV